MSKLMLEEENMRTFWKTACEEFKSPENVQQLQAAFLKHHLYQWTEIPPLGEYAWMSRWNKFRGCFSDPHFVWIDAEGNYFNDEGLGQGKVPDTDVLFSIQPRPEPPKP